MPAVVFVVLLGLLRRIFAHFVKENIKLVVVLGFGRRWRIRVYSHIFEIRLFSILLRLARKTCIHAILGPRTFQVCTNFRSIFTQIWYSFRQVRIFVGSNSRHGVLIQRKEYHIWVKNERKFVPLTNNQRRALGKYEFFSP